MNKRVEFLSNPVDAEPLFAEALAMIVSGNYTAEEARTVARQALYQNSLAKNRERLLSQWEQAYAEDEERYKSSTQVLQQECSVLENALCQVDEHRSPGTFEILKRRIKRLREAIEDIARIHRSFLHDMEQAIGVEETLKIRKAVE